MADVQAPPKPYHRWPSNENADKHPIGDRCLACGVWRYPERWVREERVAEENAKATGPCPGGTSA